MHPLHLWLDEACARAKNTADRGHVSKLVLEPLYGMLMPSELRRSGDSLSGAFLVDFTIEGT